MRTIPAFAVLCGILLATSGCVNTDAVTVATTSVPPAPSVSTAPDLGSVTGVVTSQDQLPITGADVALVPGDLKAKTDEGGAFTFNGVEPGTRTLYVQALGYVSETRRIDVRPGEATTVRVTLAEIAVVGEPFFAIFPVTFFIGFGWFGTTEYMAAFEPYFCTPCRAYRAITPGPMGGQVEADWTKTVPLPAVADRESVEVFAKPGNDTVWGVRGNFIGGGSMAPRGFKIFDEAGIKNAKKADVVVIRVYSPGATQVTIQQPIKSWTTFSYNTGLPENFTALPPR